MKRWHFAHGSRNTRRTYPWGDEEPDAERANFNQVYHGTTVVGCFAPGIRPEEGIHDLAGNVLEWTRSSYRDYPYNPDDGREGLDGSESRNSVLRGGGWVSQSNLLLASYRLDGAPDYHNYYLGCRLARRLPSA
jgi:formylglycine-generating enzyme required for sulfatase activity